jgi:hypothetical protein
MAALEQWLLDLRTPAENEVANGPVSDFASARQLSIARRRVVKPARVRVGVEVRAGMGGCDHVHDIATPTRLPQPDLAGG